MYIYKQPDLTEEIKSRISCKLKHVALCDMTKRCVGWHVLFVYYIEKYNGMHKHKTVLVMLTF